MLEDCVDGGPGAEHVADAIVVVAEHGFADTRHERGMDAAMVASDGAGGLDVPTTFLDQGAGTDDGDGLVQSLCDTPIEPVPVEGGLLEAIAAA